MHPQFVTTDGKETPVNTFGGREGKATARREGQTLIVTTKSTSQNYGMAINDTWTLGDDGKTLKIVSHVNTPRGEFNRTMLFDKQ